MKPEDEHSDSQDREKLTRAGRWKIPGMKPGPAELATLPPIKPEPPSSEAQAAEDDDLTRRFRRPAPPVGNAAGRPAAPAPPPAPERTGRVHAAVQTPAPAGFDHAAGKACCASTGACPAGSVRETGWRVYPSVPIAGVTGEAKRAPPARLRPSRSRGNSLDRSNHRRHRPTTPAKLLHLHRRRLLRQPRKSRPASLRVCFDRRRHRLRPCRHLRSQVRPRRTGPSPVAAAWGIHSIVQSPAPPAATMPPSKPTAPPLTPTLRHSSRPVSLLARSNRRLKPAPPASVAKAPPPLPGPAAPPSEPGRSPSCFGRLRGRQ